MTTIGQLSMWEIYLSHFLMHPLLISVLIISLLVSLSFFILFRNTDKIKTKTAYLYAHVLFLFFPFIFSAFLWECTMSVLMCTPKLIIYGLSGGSLIALFASFLIIPYLYPWATQSNEIKSDNLRALLKKLTRRLGIPKTAIYSLNEAIPLAYSITNIRPAIFLSVGLLEILNKKELESVLLHEAYHIKNRSSIWKFSLNHIKMFSPLSSFSSIKQSIDHEEKEADVFAIKIQGARKFLNSAKHKINRFNQERG